MSVWWYRLIPAWAPSWLVEGASGLVAVAGCALVVVGLPPWAAVLVLASAASGLYEWRVDPHGWSWDDVLQRECGIALGMVLLRLFSL